MKTEKRRSMGCAVFFLPHFGYNGFSGLVGYRLVGITIGSDQDPSLALRMTGPGAHNAGFMLIAPHLQKHKEKILWIN